MSRGDGHVRRSIKDRLWSDDRARLTAAELAQGIFGDASANHLSTVRRALGKLEQRGVITGTMDRPRVYRAKLSDQRKVTGSVPPRTYGTPRKFVYRIDDLPGQLWLWRWWWFPNFPYQGNVTLFVLKAEWPADYRADVGLGNVMLTYYNDSTCVWNDDWPRAVRTPLTLGSQRR